MDKWKKVFLQYDRDRSGVLSFREFRAMVRQSLRLSESKLTDHDLHLLFKRLDDDHSGGIEFSEFVNHVMLKKEEPRELPKTLGRALRLALVRMRVHSELEVRNLFDGLDMDSDGGISLHQLRRMLRDQLRLTQHEFSEQYIRRLFHSLDFNGSRQIEVDEFVRFVKDHADVGGRSHLNFFKWQPAGQPGAAETPTVVILPQIKAPPSPPKALLAAEKPAAPSPVLDLPGAVPEPAQQDRKLPYVGQSRREYLKIPGAERLNRVEGRLFDAGFDIRGEYFNVADAPEKLSGVVRPPERPNRPAKIASSPAVLPAATEGARTGMKGSHVLGRRTVFLQELSKQFM